MTNEEIINADKIKRKHEEIIDFYLKSAKHNTGVELAPVIHAHWDSKYVDRFTVEGHIAHAIMSRCSNCNRNITGVANYCPWCGAKMDEKGDKQ